MQEHMCIEFMQYIGHVKYCHFCDEIYPLLSLYLFRENKDAYKIQSRMRREIYVNNYDLQHNSPNSIERERESIGFETYEVQYWFPN